MQNTPDDDEPTPFIDYWNAIDKAMLETKGIDTSDTGIEPDLIADAQEAGISPADFVRWIGLSKSADKPTQSPNSGQGVAR